MPDLSDKMSTPDTTVTAGTTDDNPTHDDALQDDLADLKARFDDRLAELEAENKRLRDRITDLEAENQRLRDDLDDVSSEIERNSNDLREAFQTLTPLRKLVIGEGHSEPPVVVMKQLRDQQGPLNQQLAALNQKLPQLRDDFNDDVDRKVGILRSQQNAMIRHLADETGVDLELSAGDKVTRAREDGVDAVLASVRKRDRRAELVLQRIEEWGTKERLRAGEAYRLPRPRVKRLLNGTDDVAVTMTSKTVGDIFDAIEELAAGSTRLLKRRKVDGVDNLYVGFPETETEE
ncbi:MAG: hypothetical protein ABEI27_07300 [Halobellus sp.]|uniref:hypothetical protein n=1 Tax=Halobellus sp. TaxID=1979212 RepID=UPI0035D4D4F1